MAPWRGGAALRRAVRSGRPARGTGARGRDDPLPGPHRVPAAGPQRGPPSAPGPAAGDVRRRGPRGRHGRGLPVAPGASRSPTATGRPRRATSAATTWDSRSGRGRWGSRCPGLETRIRDGELQLRASTSPTFFAGYLGEEAGPELVDGEWWATGDLVRSDDDGYLFHEGRSDDLITSSGYRIGPGEVESALLSHPAVAEAAAVAAPDAERGSVVKAVIVTTGDGEPSAELAAELQEHVKSDRPLQVPQDRRVRGRAATNGERQAAPSGLALARRRRWRAA